jgi:hypothetical protein
VTKLTRSFAAKLRRILPHAILSWTLLAALPFGLLPPAAQAQLTGQGAIQGTVTDPSGAVVPGARVTITNTATNVKSTTVTTGAGDFNVSVAPGNYNVSVSASGFRTAVQERVTVNAMASINVPITMQTGTTTETVTVTSAPPQLETSNAALGSTIDQDLYSSLPVLQNGTQRRATDFVALMPGVNSQPTNGGQDTNTGIVNGSGSRGAVSGIYINGVPITSVAGEGDPRFIWTAMPLDSINQFQVYTAAYPAMYEGQGVINYDVKSGSNQIHGSVFEFFRNTALDTWGYLAPAAVNPLVGHPTKPVEHQNEYGFTLGFPVLKDKLFLFGTYDGYRYISGANYQYQTGPTAANLNGDFRDVAAKYGFHIYDPESTTCSNGTCTRTPFSSNGTPDVIPANRISQQARNMQKFLPAPTNDQLTSNYLTGSPTGRNNWSTANRIDYHITPSHSISAVVSFGRQSTAGAGGGISGTLSSSQNQMAPPYISYQQFFVKTKVLLFEDDYTISPHMVNQFKYGYGRYDSTGLNQDIGSNFSATAMGITGLPPGQAASSFPTVKFSGNSNSMNQWGGYSGNRNAASGYVAIDNLQWNVGKHNLTFGGEIAWMQYNFTNNSTGVNPLQLTFNSADTAKFSKLSTLDNKTGYAYASFLVGAANSGSFTQSAVPETGARFRPISPYVQDDWKVTSRLTVNMGMRWDYYPSYREVHDRLSWMSPSVINPLVNYPGALVFAGHGNGTCNCNTNVRANYKNFGPRLGFAFQSDPRTVWRGSYGVFFTHGDAVGGSALSRQGAGLMGYSVSPKSADSSAQSFTNDTGNAGASFWGLEQPFPAYQKPPVLDPTLGTYNTTNSTQPSQSVTYADPYYGGRAPEYINWTFGLQRQLTNNLAMTLSYVGSEGHFVYMDSNNARGYASNQLNPKWLSLGNALSGKTIPAGSGLTLPYPTYNLSESNLAQMLKPFPQYTGVSDAYGEVGNTSYNALQAVLQQRLSHGLTFMANYTWSRSMDDAGTFRSGYDIPAAYATDGRFHKARSLDRSVSLADQPHKFVFTGTYSLPFGKGHIGNDSFLVRALAGGWQLSGIYRIWAGSPLGITMNSCNTNPSQTTCEPILNPGFTGRVRINGSYGHAPGSNAKTLNSMKYIDGNAFAATPDFMFSTLSRTAPLGLRNSGSYALDMSVRRTFPIWERTSLEIQADAFNVTNHTWFGYGSSGAILGWSNSSITSNLGVQNQSRDIQIAGHIRF